MKKQSVTLSIEGMTCAHCAQSIEQLLRRKEGILDVSVDFAAGTCHCSFDASQTNEQDIIDSINQTQQYKAKQANPPRTEEKSSGPFVSSSAGSYDLIIIGGGSAAFSAAITAESLGLKTLMVNAGLDIGGTCVNVGCVPSKYFIRAAEAAHRARHAHFPGIRPQGAHIDYTQLLQTKRQLVATLRQQKYIDVVKDFKHLTILQGFAKFRDSHHIEVNGQVFRAVKFLIATGATTHIPNIEGLEDIDYLTPGALFELEALPPSLTVLGAGYIGCELAMAYNRLGVKVRIIEFTDRVLRHQTPDVSQVIEAQMRKEGIELLPNHRVEKFEKKGEQTIIHCRRPDGSTIQLTETGSVLVATGTQPNTSGMGLETIGLQLSDSGHVVVNERMETNLPHIYAAGDVVNTPAYVYTAAYEGKIAVENAFTAANKQFDYSALPWVIFTSPQVAGTGLDEAQAAARGIPHEVSKIELRDVPRSIVAQDTTGFIKLIRHSETHCLLGARIVAPEGGELVQALSMAIQYGIDVQALAENLYPYLTLSEGIKLAALAFNKDVSKLSCCAS
ncbi:MAG: mercuric reductase [Thermonema sp.]|uniref:mercury(II) reductase n=1 Tax=Thermonema sp. TaxID=2231181 RepID=UPI0021DCD3F1|nr:mercury(II) reductase [Thermonema sp.]GIV39188.1 MAG: mercuric reductase [Thermonema sp.]